MSLTDLPRIGDLLAPVTASVRPSDTLRAAAVHLDADHVGALLVIAHDGAVGLISERDLVRSLAEGLDPDVERVDNWMTAELLTATLDTTVPAAIELMEANEIRHLVVTTATGMPAGVVSLRRLVAGDVILPA